MAEKKVTNVESGVRDVLNAGLGLFQTVSAKVENVQKDILSSFNSLVSRGASDKSELAQKLRGGLDKGLTVVKEVETKLGIKTQNTAAVSNSKR